MGYWAIGILQKKFWGLPEWAPRFVLLKNGIYWKGRTYFVDGKRSEGWLEGMLPIIQIGPYCNRSKFVEEAGVELRVLREGPSAMHSRLIGYVWKAGKGAGWWVRPVAHTFVPRAQIRITGSTSSRIVTSDALGIYDVDLPEGDYTVQLLAHESYIDGPLIKMHMDGRSPVAYNLFALGESAEDRRQQRSE